MFVINLLHLFICAVRTALKTLSWKTAGSVACAVCDPFPRVRTSGSRLWHAAGVGGICVPPKSPFLFFLSFGKKISFGHILVSFGERYEANNRESFFVYFVYFKHIKPPLTSVAFFLFFSFCASTPIWTGKPPFFWETLQENLLICWPRWYFFFPPVCKYLLPYR